MTGGDAYRGKRVLVLGAARSGTAAARLLAGAGTTVRLVDAKERAALPGLEALEALGVEVRTGRHDPADLDGIDLVVTSPGIPKTAPPIRDTLARGVPLVAEIEVAAAFTRAPIAAVTGTNGKSTTVSVLGALLREGGVPSAVAGNIGLPLSAVALEVPEDGAVALEVSSFQLEDIREFRPKVAVILNLTPDHLDRYASLAEYGAAKARLFENQTPADVAVLPARDEALGPIRDRVRARVVTFGDLPDVERGVAYDGAWIVSKGEGGTRRLLPAAEISIPGPHNRANAMAALAAAEALGVDPEKAAPALRSFRPLAHRLEKVGEVNGVRFYDDSKATNLEAMEVALQSFEEPIHLIAGGRDKGQTDWTRVHELLRRRVRDVVLIGEVAGRMKKAWRGIDLYPAGSMEEAVDKAYFSAAEGDVVLLSPGCASFDMFENYEHRGRVFGDAVRALEARMGRS
jgi:UDP-N-acetylmuramoylalanine--D-glutamate ligase